MSAKRWKERAPRTLEAGRQVAKQLKIFIKKVKEKGCRRNFLVKSLTVATDGYQDRPAMN